MRMMTKESLYVSSAVRSILEQSALVHCFEATIELRTNFIRVLQSMTLNIPFLQKMTDEMVHGCL